jgi:hypothetical protein
MRRSDTLQVVAMPGRASLPIGAYDLARLGYELSEFTVGGVADSYELLDAGPDGASWTVRENGSSPFTTRLVLARPADGAKFNGTVIVEWMNVSGALDAPVAWHMAHRELIRGGYAYVGVSVQKAGIDGGLSSTGRARPLKEADPDRYAHLSHPGDAYAFSIFAQVGAMLRGAAGGQVLGPLKPQRLIAAGESQSAVFLTTYLNAISPLFPVYDGYLIHSRFGGAAALDGSSILAPPTEQIPQVQRFRTDLPVPVLVVITETDLLGGGFRGRGVNGYLLARQPDSDRLRVWEVAGTAHADNYNYIVSFIDSGDLPLEQLAAAYRPNRTASGAELDRPMNFGPQHHYVVQAAFAKLDAWLRTGAAPPQAPPLEVVPGDPPHLATDELGIALGGVRTPWVDEPTALLAGYGNSGDDRAFLVGVGEPFVQAQLDRLYPGGKSEYMRRFGASLSAAIDAGFILAADRDEILKLAELSYHGV